MTAALNDFQSKKLGCVFRRRSQTRTKERKWCISTNFTTVTVLLFSNYLEVYTVRQLQLKILTLLCYVNRKEIYYFRMYVLSANHFRFVFHCGIAIRVLHCFKNKTCSLFSLNENFLSIHDNIE